MHGYISLPAVCSQASKGLVGGASVVLRATLPAATPTRLPSLTGSPSNTLILTAWECLPPKSHLHANAGFMAQFLISSVLPLNVLYFSRYRFESHQNLAMWPVLTVSWYRSPFLYFSEIVCPETLTTHFNSFFPPLLPSNSELPDRLSITSSV